LHERRTVNARSGAAHAVRTMVYDIRDMMCVSACAGERRSNAREKNDASRVPYAEGITNPSDVIVMFMDP